MTGKARNSVRVSCITSGSNVECYQTSDDFRWSIRVGELHFASPVPDEGGCPTELEGKWGESTAHGLTRSC